MVIILKINFKSLLLCIIITFFIGSFFAFFISSNSYVDLNKIIDVPGYIFPIVWRILYLLMGISLYIIYESYGYNKKSAIKIYFIQLLVNSFWTLIFFGFKLYLLGFIWILFLIVLVIIMIVKFYNINKLSGLMNIPYLFWLIFAGFLNLSIVILN